MSVCDLIEQLSYFVVVFHSCIVPLNKAYNSRPDGLGQVALIFKSNLLKGWIRLG